MNSKFDYLLCQEAAGRTLIFDLDDTIYPELDFLKQQYLIVAKKFNSKDIDSAYNFLVNTFQVHGRKLLFDKFKAEYEITDSIDAILSEFRNYSNGVSSSLTPYNWFIEFSDKLKGDLHLLIVTNGNVDQQKEKARRLQLDRYFKLVSFVFANNYEPKPSSASLKKIQISAPFKDPIYIGDSLVDKDFASNCGFEFLHIGEVIRK